MASVDINDRGSLERAYPEDAFASDAAQNEAVSSQFRHGVRIGGAPDRVGRFELARVRRHAGEAAAEDFLIPRKEAGYTRFLDDIVEAANRVGFRTEESPGLGDPRLRGLRQ